MWFVNTVVAIKTFIVAIRDKVRHLVSCSGCGFIIHARWQFQLGVYEHHPIFSIKSKIRWWKDVYTGIRGKSWPPCMSNCINLHPFLTIQYTPRNMHTVFALLCFVVVMHWLIFPYPSGLLHWHCGNLTIAPVPAKQPWWIWINTSCEFIMNDCITTTKQSTRKPCAYFLGYTVTWGYMCNSTKRSFYLIFIMCITKVSIVSHLVQNITPYDYVVNVLLV